MQKVVCNLKKFMDQNELNIMQLAEKLSVSNTTVRGYSKNTFTRIDADTAIKICNYFKVSLGEMFEIVDE